MRRKQTIVLEISYAEESSTEDSSHTYPPSRWNWNYILNEHGVSDVSKMTHVDVIASGDTIPDA